MNAKKLTVDRVRDLFQQASVDPARWQEALDAMARATGSLRGQLLGIGTDGALSFNLITNADASFEADFTDIAASHAPHMNYRVDASQRAAPGQILHEVHYSRARRRCGWTAYEEACEKHHLPFGCQVALSQEPDMLIGMALLRSRDDGPTTEQHRTFFARVAQQARAAARLQAMIDGRGIELARGMLDAVGSAALLIDGFGRVAASTPAADRMLAMTRRLAVRAGVLSASTQLQTNQIRSALEAVLAGTIAAQNLLLRGGGEPPLRLELQALPRRDWDFGFLPRAIIVLKGGGSGPNRLAEAFQLEFALTAAEAEVAVALAGGVPRSQIADQRGTSLGTVRQQVKSIFGKFGVGREAEFMLLAAAFERESS